MSRFGKIWVEGEGWYDGGFWVDFRGYPTLFLVWNGWMGYGLGWQECHFTVHRIPVGTATWAAKISPLPSPLFVHTCSIYN